MPDTTAGPTLVVLAAGLGRRFGGLKQLAGVGPGGATLLEYSLFDARRAGFDDVVFVIRPDMQDTFRHFAEGRLPSSLPHKVALQRLDRMPGTREAPVTRTKPWGTAHAVLSARALVDGPFAVINADDYYGPDAFTAMAAFLRSNPRDWALVGYLIGDTLSDAGGVNRAVLGSGPTGALVSVDEVFDIERIDGGQIVGRGEAGMRVIPESALVSMNCWGFQLTAFDLLEAAFDRFLQSADLERDEFPLPVAVQEAIATADQVVRVLAPRSQWFGMTHPDDLPAVRDALERLVAAGLYPERLWS
jgi:NDP-sugar pyrophosphorylase family protein